MKVGVLYLVGNILCLSFFFEGASTVFIIVFMVLSAGSSLQDCYRFYTIFFLAIFFIVLFYAGSLHCLEGQSKTNWMESLRHREGIKDARQTPATSSYSTAK